MTDLRNEKITKGRIQFWRNDVIGRSPLSTIFKGTFEGRIDVAVKRISIDLAKLAENEIDVLLVKTDHDNVIKYYCKEQDDDFCYIATELCACNLEEYVQKKGNHCPSLPNTPVEEILGGVAEGLSHIHKRDIIHRDIKPSNILLFIKENKLVAKISDFGISRIIPAHQTILANFSAGTDLYKAPELLTPPFSWRSDIYAFGLVIFYVLSKGKHLFNNNLGQIIKGNPLNLRELNGQPAALSLVKWLTAFNQEERPRMSEVVHHPFFWDDEKKLNFIIDVHQVIEDRQNAFLKEVIEGDSHHVICSSPDKCGNQETPPDPAACADWTCSLTPSVRADCPRNVNNKSCAELVRIIKYKLTHFYDLKEAVKAEYGDSIEEFRRYWLDRFPSLVVHLWEKMEITHPATLLWDYYAPESVRRTNVESNLLRTIDEGTLGDPQELSNKVIRLGTTMWNRALHSAVVKGRKEYVEVLLKHCTGPDVGYVHLITSLLGDAARNGFVEVAELLIECGAEVNCKDKIRRTPLHLAAAEGHPEVANLLIERGAEVNCKDKYGDTPLYTAATEGHPEVAKLLIERGAEVNCKDKTGWTPLHVAAENGHLPVVQLLINRGAEVSCKNAMGHTPLDYATRKSRTEVIEFLRNFPSENLPRKPETSYYAPESVRGKTEETTLLGKIDKGELGTGTGRSTAAERQQQQQQQPQQQQEDAAAVPKEDPQTNENYENFLAVQTVATPHPPLPMSPPIPEFIPAPEWVRGKSVETTVVQKSDEDELGNLQELINKVKRLGSKLSEGALSSAKKQRTEHLEDSLKNMSVTDTERKDRFTTLLHNAAGDGLVEEVQLLIEHGAQVNCKDKNGSTPLHAAASKGHSAVAQLLIERGAEVNCKNVNGETPLHRAALNGHSAVAQLLIELDAQVNCKTEDGETPLDYAMKKSHTEVTQFLSYSPAEILSQEPEMTGMAEDVKKVPLVLENSDRTMKIGIAASTIEEVITKAKKLKLVKDDTKCSVFLSSDRKTELVDNDYLCSLERNTRLIVLTENDITEQNRPSIDEQDSGSTEGPWKPVFRKITQNLGLIALLGEDELEAIADEDHLTSLAGSDPEFCSWSAKDVEEIQEHCQRMLESKREIRQALDLVQLYKRSREQNEISNEQNGKLQ